MKTIRFWVGVIGLTMLVVAALHRDADGLSNPLARGKNTTAVATTTAKRVPAQGTNCAVTFLNFSNEVLCTGYGSPIAAAPTTMADGGVTCANSVDVCKDPAGTTTCVNTWFVRDSVPDALWYRMKTAADGGVGIRIEMGAGCQSP